MKQRLNYTPRNRTRFKYPISSLLSIKINPNNSKEYTECKLENQSGCTTL
jgi:hypothetical protein